MAAALLGSVTLFAPLPARADDSSSNSSPTPPLAPGQERPLPQESPPGQFDFTIEAPRKSPVPRAAEELAFAVKDVQIAGVGAYKDSDLRPIVQPLIGATVHLADLLAAAEKIEARYRDDGYILSRAIVPTQTVKDGIFRIEVIEGYVAGVSVTGGDRASRAAVEKLMAPVLASRPLKQGVIVEALLRANEIPGAKVSGLLRASATVPGASDLIVTISRTPFTTLLTVDNRGAETTGYWTNTLIELANSPFDDGGQVTLLASTAFDFPERHAFQAKYAAPLGTSGLIGSLTGLISKGEPGGSLGTLSLISNSTSIGPRVDYPLLLSREQKLTLEAGFTVQSADVHALGAPLSHDEWRDVDVGVAYQNNILLGGTTTGSLDLAQGITDFGASPNGAPNLSRPDARTDFTKLVAIGGHDQPLGDNFTLTTSLDGQLTPDTLLTGEEVNFGGAQYGRGYDPSALTGDNGIGATAEMKYDLKPRAPFSSEQLYGFYDIARAEVHTGELADDKIESVGAGIRTAEYGNVTTALEVAHSLIPVPTSGSDRRGYRLLFNGTLRF